MKQFIPAMGVLAVLAIGPAGQADINDFVDEGATFTDATNYYYPTVVKQGGTYHMWFQKHGGTDDLWYTSSADGQTGWTAPVQALINGVPFTKWQMHPTVVDTGSGFRVYWSGSTRGIDVAETSYTNPTSWNLVGTDIVTRGASSQFHQDTASSHPITQWYDAYVYKYGDHYEGYFQSDYGLHYGMSANGLTDWTAMNTVTNTSPPPEETTGPPVFQKAASGAWDSQTIGKATVLRLDDDEYYMWYGSGKSGDPVNYAAGIGFATSSNGIDWTRDLNNPLFHVTDPGQTYRTRRTYTPWVMLDGDELRMYFSAQYRIGTTDFDSIGYATAQAPAPVPVPGAALLGMIGLGMVGWMKRRKAVAAR